MGRTFTSLDDFRNTLNVAVNTTIEDRILDGIREAIQASEEKNVYTNMPKWEWALQTRRRENSGIKDKKNMVEHTDLGDPNLKTIEVKVEASWQWAEPVRNYGMKRYMLRGGKAPNQTEDLVETIESKGMYATPPRPFMESAERDYVATRADTDLSAGLKDLGFD